MTSMHEHAPDDGRDAPAGASRDHTWSEGTAGLRVRWNELLGAMEDARTAGVESWPEVRSDMTRAFGEAQHALEVAVRRFQELRRARADQRHTTPPGLADGPSRVLDAGPGATEPSPAAPAVSPEATGERKLRAVVDPEC